MVASAIRAVFEQPDEASAREQLDRVIDGLRLCFPQVGELLAEAEPDLLVFAKDLRDHPKTDTSLSLAPDS